MFWQKGSVKGLKAVGNFTVDIDWDATKATKVQIVSNMGTTCVVKYAGVAKDYKVTTTDGNAVAATRISDDEISFQTVRAVHIFLFLTPQTLSQLFRAIKTERLFQ